MSTSSLIRRFIWALPMDTIFTTRDLLRYGTRCAVDQILYRLVRAGEITRLARGVFVRPKLTDSRPISVEEVSRAKIQAFGKNSVSHFVQSHPALEDSYTGRSRPMLGTSGHNTSLVVDAYALRVHYEGTGPRRIKLGDTPLGIGLRALWKLGKHACNVFEIETLIRGISRAQQEELAEAARWLPAWLNDHFTHVRRLSRSDPAITWRVSPLAT